MYVGCMPGFSIWCKHYELCVNDTGVRCARKAPPSLHDDSESTPLTMYLFYCSCLLTINLGLFFLHISNSLLRIKVHAFRGPCSLSASTGKQRTKNFSTGISTPSSSWGAILTIMVTKYFYKFMSVLMYEILISCYIKIHVQKVVL